MEQVRYYPLKSKSISGFRDMKLFLRYRLHALAAILSKIWLAIRLLLLGMVGSDPSHVRNNVKSLSKWVN